MKTLNKILLIGLVAGSFNSYGQEVEFKIFNVNTDSLDKYTEENQKVYRDFEEFMKDNGLKTDEMAGNIKEKNYRYINDTLDISYYGYRDDSLKGGGNLRIFFKETKTFLHDSELDGFGWGKKYDFINYGGKDWKTPLDLSEKDQMTLAKDYTNLLKRIMHNKK